MENKKEAVLITPKPFAIVGLKFDLIAEIPKSWLSSAGHGFGIGWMSINGNYLPMSGPSAEIIPSFLSKIKQRVRIKSRIELYSKDPEHPQGLIIEINGNENEQFTLFPFIIKGTNPIYDKEQIEIKKYLSNSVARTTKLKSDWNTYWSELERISRQQVWDKKISDDIFNILNNSEEKFAPFVESEEEREERELREKYKDAIEWQGPILGGRAGDINGFDFRVNSGDHSVFKGKQISKHFHVVHKGRGINARFSYPEIDLVDYLGHSNTMGAKEVVKIKEYFSDPNHLKKLESEFQKQIAI
ncbi:MAG: hypothetical protein WCX97_02055 [Candidatus Magasanikbacteria bacterium]